MRKLVLGLLVAVVAAVAQADLFDDAVRLAKTSGADIPGKAAFSVARAVLSRDEVAITAMDGNDVGSPYGRFVFVFVDDVPGANWAHPCRYVIFNEDLSECEVIRRTLPPTLRYRAGDGRIALCPVEGGPKPVSLEATVGRVRAYANSLRSAAAAPESAGVVGNPTNSYFLLISGGANPPNNGIRFWADTAMYYSTLTLKYGVPKENIALLVSDGGATNLDAVVWVYTDEGRTNSVEKLVSSPTDMDGDGVADVTGPATRAAVSEALESFRSKLTKDDQLTVFVSSHGNVDGEISPTNRNCHAFLFDMEKTSEIIRDTELAAQTEGIGCPVGFVFETCCSGGFIDDLTNTPDRVIATACGHDQFSFGSEGEIDEEAFAAFDGAICSCNSWVLPFNCAMRGNVPDSVVNDGSYPWRDSEDEVDRAYCLVADANGDGRISFFEAFEFSAKNDEYAQPGSDPHEDPQFAESTPGLGKRFFTLKQEAGPKCTGGGIAAGRDGVWVVSPDAGVEAVAIADLPEGAKVAVKCGDSDVPGEAFMGFGEGRTECVFSLALNPEGEVGGIRVKPTIGDLEEGTPFAAGDGSVAVTVKAIAGLKYALKRATALRGAAESGWEVVGGRATGEGGPLTLTDADPPKGAAFYEVEVTRP